MILQRGGEPRKKPSTKPKSKDVMEIHVPRRALEFEKDIIELQIIIGGGNV